MIQNISTSEQLNKYMKYLHYILIVILLIISSTTMAQEILFEKKIGESTIKLTDSGGVYRSLYINDSIKKGVVMLEEYRYDPMSRGGDEPNQNPGHWFGIINTTVKDGIVYILYYNYGLVELKSYCFLKDDKIKVKNYFIDKQGLISFMNGGGVNFFAEMKWFNGDLFFYLNASQQYGGGGTSGLFKYNSNADNLKIVVLGQCKMIKDQEKLFVNLDLDENKEAISEHIKEVLLENEQLNKDNEFKYLGYVDDFSSFFCVKNSNVRVSGMIFFLYQDASSLLDSIKIIAYDNYDKEWLMCDYSEVALKAPNEESIFNRK